MFTIKFKLEPQNNKALQALVGFDHENFTYLEENLNIEISGQSFNLLISAQNESAAVYAQRLIQELYQSLVNKSSPKFINHQQLEQFILHWQQQNNPNNNHSYLDDDLLNSQQIDSHLIKGKIKFRNQAQQNYLTTIQNNSVTFGIGPAGTGKTFLAVAYAIDALINQQIDRIFITRPLVEAGEQIGFLPGDIKNKLDPYLKPMFDAISDIVGSERATILLEKGIIEITPLAYMRGRTFNNSVVILDEGQNATPLQIKLILTRIGYNCKTIINGDLTQIDLKGKSGLKIAIDIFSHMPKDIAIFHFTYNDIVRSRIAKLIVNTYEKFESLQPIKNLDSSKTQKISIHQILKSIEEQLSSNDAKPNN